VSRTELRTFHYACDESNAGKPCVASMVIQAATPDDADQRMVNIGYRHFGDRWTCHREHGVAPTEEQ
jgi:hypothetical protein